MPKLKTKKAVKKRVKVTKNNKYLIRRGRQDHFNSRDTGDQTRRKRRDVKLSKTNKDAIEASIPYEV